MEESHSEKSMEQSVANLTISGGQSSTGAQFNGDPTFNFTNTESRDILRCHYAFRQSHPVKAFVKRPELFDAIEEQLQATNDEDAAQRCVVLHGLGGSGKTQLALSYLQSHKSDYHASFWISAASIENAHRDIRNVYCLTYGIHHASTELPPVHHIMSLVRDKVDTSAGRTLFICDSADSIEDIDESDAAVDITQFLPTSNRADIIITSRSPAACSLATGEPLKIDVMTTEQSVLLFLKMARVKPTEETAEHVKEIVQKLGNLPLAVSLAGAYVAETPRLSKHIENFLSEFQAKKARFLQRQPKWIVDYYPASVLTT